VIKDGRFLISPFIIFALLFGRAAAGERPENDSSGSSFKAAALSRN